MYDEYENNFEIVFEGELPNGLEVCVWRDVDNGVWEVSVVDPHDIWNTQYDERFRDARSVLEYVSELRLYTQKD